MTPANLQNALIERIKQALDEFPLRTTYNNPEPFKVFKQKIPEGYSSDFDYSEESADKANYPFCSVKLTEGTKGENQGTQTTTVVLMIGVKNEDKEGAGFDDVLATSEAILGDLHENPIVDKKYILKYPVTWMAAEEETHPYYFMGIELKFESNTLANNFKENHI